MIEITLTVADAAELQVVADAVARLADLRRSQEAMAFNPEAISALAQTGTITVTPEEPAKKRGRPPKVKDAEPADVPANPDAEVPAPAPAPVEPEPAPTPAEPILAPAAPAAPTLSLEDVRAKLAEISRAGKAAEVKALMAELGAAKLSDIPPTQYQQLLEKASAL